MVRALTDRRVAALVAAATVLLVTLLVRDTMHRMTAPWREAVQTAAPPRPLSVTPSAGQPGEADRSTAPAGYPPPPNSPEPKWTASPTPDYAAALPPGAVVGPAPSYWHFDRERGRQLEDVPYTLDGVPGLAVVDVAADPPRRLWSVADAGIAAPPEAGVFARGMHSLGHVVAIAGLDELDLVVLDYRDGLVTVAHRFLVADRTVVDGPAGLELVDLSGDGVPERLLLAADPPRAWLFPAAVDQAAAATRSGPAPTAALPVGTIRGAVQLLDSGSDGRFDLLTAEEPGRWRVYSWQGEALVPVETLTDTLAAEPRRVSEGSMPALPRDLFYWRDGQVLRLARAGGPAEVVYSGPDEAGWSAPSERSGYLFQRPFAVSRDGRVLAVLEQGCDEPKCSTAEFRFQVRDLATGSATSVRWHNREDESDKRGPHGAWSLSEDGRWLVFLEPAAGAPAGSNEQARQGGSAAGGTIVAVDLQAAPPGRHALAACQPLDAGPEHWVIDCDPDFAIAPDGSRVAYGDPRALRLLALPGGDGVDLVENWFGASEAAVRRYLPSEWSPDGRRLLVRVGYYEGTSAAVIDRDSGQLWSIPDSGEYEGPSSTFAWLPGAQALVHARADGRRGEVPLRLVRLAAPSGAPAPGPDGSSSTGASTAETAQTDLIAARSLGHGADLSAVAPTVAPDGTIRFVLRDAAGAAYPGNGLYEVRPDGSRLRRLAGLPLPRQPGLEELFVSDYGLWAPDAEALLLFSPGAPGYVVDPNDFVLLVAGDGLDVLDVTPVLAGGAWFVFAGEAP